MKTFIRLRRLVMLFAALLLACACSKSKFEPYSPHENLLSIAAEFELLDSRNPYTDPPADELTGQNIARATLVRLANYESLHPERFAPEVAFMKARAWERLGEFDAALRAFRQAQMGESPLREEATRRADYVQQLLDARRLDATGAGLDEILDSLQRQAEALKAFDNRVEDPYYSALARAEAEQSEVRHAELVALNRWVLVDGENRAIEEMRRVVANHTQSHRALEHALRLARLYRDLAYEELRLNPPHTADYDAERTMKLIDDSLDLFYRVSQADGREERLLAAAELNATLALRELVAARSD